MALVIMLLQLQLTMTSFFYSWDIRWDLYEQLGHPSIANLDDYFNMLVDMKGICPRMRMANETYTTSIWPDWDGTMVMYIKAAATAYYGYDELLESVLTVQTVITMMHLKRTDHILQCLSISTDCIRQGFLIPTL